MGNAVATRSGGAVATQNDNPWLAASADAMQFEGNFLKLNGNSGDYEFGQEGTELAVGTRLAAYMPGGMHGFLCWVDSEVVDRALTPIENGPKPDPKGLADHGPYATHDDGTKDGWAEHHTLPMADENGEKYSFQVGSKSALNSVKKFYAEYGKQRSQHIDGDGNYMLPIVELDVGSFVLKNNKKAGKKYFPILKIVDWISAADLADVFSGVGEGEDDPAAYAEQAAAVAPAPKQRAAKPAPVKQPEPEPEPEPVEEAQEEAPAPEPAPAAKKRGFGKPAEAPAEADAPAPTTTTKAATNAAAAAAQGRRAKRF